MRTNAVNNNSPAFGRATVITKSFEYLQPETRMAVQNVLNSSIKTIKKSARGLDLKLYIDSAKPDALTFQIKKLLGNKSQKSLTGSLPIENIDEWMLDRSMPAFLKAFRETFKLVKKSDTTEQTLTKIAKVLNDTQL